jgi:predicted transcriptional regulator
MSPVGSQDQDHHNRIFSSGGSQRRSRLEVKIDIMRAIFEGAVKPAHIMYRSNLSWNIAHNALSLMEKQGLVITADSEGRRCYFLTEKGVRVLNTYKSLKNELEPLPLVSIGGTKENDRTNSSSGAIKVPC